MNFDLVKVYDSVERSYILSMLRAQGFAPYYKDNPNIFLMLYAILTCMHLKTILLAFQIDWQGHSSMPTLFLSPHKLYI
jgi:hypothetical protein